MIPGAVPQSLNSLTDLEKIKEQSQWVDVSINTELSTAGQKSGPRRPPRRVKRRHTWEWMWAEWSVWGEAQPRSGEPCSDRLTRGPTEAHPERERERERERENFWHVTGPLTKWNFLSYFLPCLFFTGWVETTAKDSGGSELRKRTEIKYPHLHLNATPCQYKP